MEFKFCESRDSCICISRIKNQFFTKLKRFGVHIEIDGQDVVFICTRTASREPPVIKVPLILLAQILSTENVYQVFNAGAAGGPYKNLDELVRVFDLKTFGKTGKQILQLHVPATGGLTMTALNQWGDEPPLGMKSTSVHFLPVELLAFLDVAPYLFLNRGEDPHTFWTATAVMMALRNLVEVALNFRELDTLSDILELLKTKSPREVMVEALDASAQDEDLASLDHAYIRSPDFQVESGLLREHDPSLFNQVMCCLIFHLRYKLVDFEEDDNFIKRAEVVFQEPPCMVYNSPENKWRANYLERMDYILLEDENGEKVCMSGSEFDGSTPRPPSGWATTPEKNEIDGDRVEVACQVEVEASTSENEMCTSTKRSNESEVEDKPLIKRKKMDQSERGQIHLHFHLAQGMSRVMINTSGSNLISVDVNSEEN